MSICCWKCFICDHYDTCVDSCAVVLCEPNGTCSDYRVDDPAGCHIIDCPSFTSSSSICPPNWFDLALPF